MAETNGASEKIYVSEVLSRDATAFAPPARESVRGVIALLLLGILVAELAFAAVAVTKAWMPYDQAKEFLQIMLTPTVGLVGAVTGFYYSSNARQ